MGVGVGVGVAVAVGAGESVGLGVGADRDVASVGSAEVSGGVDWLHAARAIAAREHTANRPKRAVRPSSLVLMVVSIIPTLPYPQSIGSVVA